MKNKPVYEYTDKRASLRYQIEQDNRRRERQRITKIIGKNYFTNKNEREGLTREEILRNTWLV